MGKKLAIVYDTRRGSTEKIATYMGNILRQQGWVVDVCRVFSCDDLSAYDSVFILSPVYYEKPLDSVIGWIKRYADVLATKDVCLTVVCMAGKFGHPFKKYVYTRYLGKMRKALGVDPVCEGDIEGYIFRENPKSYKDADKVISIYLQATDKG